MVVVVVAAVEEVAAVRTVHILTRPYREFPRRNGHWSLEVRILEFAWAGRKLQDVRV